MAIYGLGTASLAANGEVTGAGTTWKAPLTLIRVGATIVFKTEPVQIYTISEIISDTRVNVYNPNSETVPTGTGYAILAHDGITVQGLAQDVAETLRYYQSRETEVADAVDAFNNFDIADFDSKVTQVNTQHSDVVTIGAQVSADSAQVTADKNSASASAISASADKDAAAASAQEAADYAASLDTQNLLRKDLAFSDLTDKALARENLNVYSKTEVTASNTTYNPTPVYNPMSVKDALDRTLHLDDFIPPNVDTSAVNCAEWISNAFRFAFENGCKLIASAKKTYATSQTIIIPQNFDSTFLRASSQEFDGNGCTFKMLSDVTLFESGYKNASGDYVSNIFTEYDSHYSKFITIGNFSVTSSTPSGRLSAPVMRIQDWHHGSKLHKIYCSCASFALYSINNYYLEYEDLVFEYPSEKVGDRFVFAGNINLNVMRRLIATNAETQYRFDGPVTATLVDGCSVEGCNVGFDFKSEIFDLAINNCYIENVSDVSVYFGTYVHSASFSNNYVNFVEQPNMRFLGYNPTPATNITIESSNYFSVESQIFKTVESTYGNGIRLIKGGVFGSNVKSLVSDSSKIGGRVHVEQRVYYPGYTAVKSNGFNQGVYSGKFSSGYDLPSGFDVLNPGTQQLLLQTAIEATASMFIHVNITFTTASVSKVIKGLFMGGDFYKFTTSGVELSLDLTIDNSDAPYVRILGNPAIVDGVVSSVTGEIRLL